ncbi:MAG: SDR family NAD(P)-dependent oxidoreductase [Geminicoccaceae bacterium]
MRADLSGHVAMVTGASGGLGSHFSRVLADNGAAVALTARRLDRLRDLARDLAKGRHRAHAIAMDVTDDASVEAAFAEVEAHFGPVDILINNAGIVAGGTAMETDTDTFADVINVNLNAPYRVARRAARALVQTDRAGSIINIASILGFRVGGRVASYAVSKAAVVQMTKALALEWARHKIRVNAIAPGYIETDINRDFLQSDAGQAMVKRIPQRRFGEADDLDGALLLLASDASRYMTGSTITVDGGHLLSPL